MRVGAGAMAILNMAEPITEDSSASNGWMMDTSGSPQACVGTALHMAQYGVGETEPTEPMEDMGEGV